MDLWTYILKREDLIIPASSMCEWCVCALLFGWFMTLRRGIFFNKIQWVLWVNIIVTVKERAQKCPLLWRCKNWKQCWKPIVLIICSFTCVFWIELTWWLWISWAVAGLSTHWYQTMLLAWSCPRSPQKCFPQSPREEGRGYSYHLLYVAVFQ